MAPTLTTITGALYDGAGNPVQDAQVLLQPEPGDPASPVAAGGIGVILHPVEVLSGSDGAFSITAIVGMRYRMVIDAIGFSEVFVAPSADTRFDLLGITPTIGSARDYIDASAVQHVELSILVPRVPTTLTRYDTLVIERSTTPTGPWTEISTQLLNSAVNVYTYDDSDGALPDGYYHAFFENSGNGDTSDFSDPLLGSAFPDSLIISIEELKEVYLFGVNLTNDDGEPFPDTMYRNLIQAATRWMEHELGIAIVAHNVVNELHDHYARDYGNWGYFQANEWPLIRIDKVAFQYPSMTSEAVIPLDWVIVPDEGCHGIIQLVPGRGNLSDVLITPGALLPLWSASNGRVPGVWKLSYRSGFEVGKVPADLKHAIAMQAAIGPLNIAGDLIGGAGVANFSISIPGLSQSVGTTSSPMYAGYGARVIEYQKELKDLMPALKNYYTPPMRMVVV